jgi:predicted DNA-binding transcriptional regulator AlpA
MGKQFLATSEFATTTEKAGKPKGASSVQLFELTFHTSIFDALSDSAFIRESQLVQSPKRPKNPALLPFSAPTLWRKVKAGTFPRPVKLSARVTAWNCGYVRRWLDQQAGVKA